MNDQTDSQLLRAYTEHRSESAFAELARRHVDLVYSAARRMVCDAHLAQDVTQGVFLALAKNAAQLAGRPVLSGWLHRTAQNIAAQTVRTDVRRRVREQEAASMNELLSAAPDAPWENIAPHLDAALGDLAEPDRDALLLRYFERKSAREMALALGVSEDAAQKRVNRAVERLREIFSKRNVTVGASGLAVIISANAVQAAPAGLAVAISAAGAAALTTTTLITHPTMNWLTLKSLTAIFSAAILTGTTVYLAQKKEVKRLEVQNGNLVAQVDALTTERDATIAADNELKQEVESLKKDHSDLLRLRSEVGLLRTQVKAAQGENRALQAQAASTSTRTGGQASSPTQSSPDAELNACINNLRQIDGAMQQFALEKRLPPTATVTADDILPYLKWNVLPQCPSGGTYTFGSLTNAPVCSIPGHTLSSGPPATESTLGVVIDALIQDNGGKLPKAELAAAREAFKQDHNGQAPSGINELVPYLSQPGPRLQAAENYFKQDHNGQAATTAVELAPYLQPASQ